MPALIPGERSRDLSFATIALSAVAGSLLCASDVSAQTLTNLANFNGIDGAYPYAGLIADASGNLFGTTTQGGAYGKGTVFELAKTAGGYATTPNVLVSFNGTDGQRPDAGLLADANGNLFGTTEQGGASGDGTVFEIAKIATGYATTPSTLVSFNGTDGQYPVTGLIADADGNLFGTTVRGGLSGDGTVFEIAKTASGYATTPTTLVSFNGANGAYPTGGLLTDTNGNLFGTTNSGGSDYGTVFEIFKGVSGYASTPTTLVIFNGYDGFSPSATLIADANGNLFGTTQYDENFSAGTVFEIVRTASGYASTPTTLVSFNNTDGAYPSAALIADANGNLFSTTSGGGSSSTGTIFEIAKTAIGYASTPTTLVAFNSSTGYTYAGLIADGNGNLYGTTVTAGTSPYGTVFEITGSGFMPPVKFAGVPGRADCSGVSISALAQTYGGKAHAATALGYGNETALENAIKGYCAK